MHSAASTTWDAIAPGGSDRPGARTTRRAALPSAPVEGGR